MKKKSFFAVFLFAASLFMMPEVVCAQKWAGQFVVTGAVGYSLSGIMFGVMQDELNTSGEVKSTKTPVVAGALDYGVTDRFSLGALYSYQGFTTKYDAFETINSAGDTTITYGNFNDRLIRQSVGIRPCFHLGERDDLDIYVGLRVAYVFWNHSSTRTDVNSVDFLKSFGGPVKAQGVFGMRYFFTPNIGVNAEFAIGPTYFMMFGLNAKFGGM